MSSVWDKLKCTTCEQRLDGRFILHNQKKYHKECFKCLECSKPINEDPFIMKGDRPMCMQCMAKKQITNARTCIKCRQKIRGASILFDEKNFHINCFKCSECPKKIDQKRFHTKNGQPLCRHCTERNQYKCNFVEKTCHKCKLKIPLGTKYLANRDQTRFFHSECFKCKECKHTIPSGDPFYKSGNDIDIAICIDCGDQMMSH